MINLIEKRRSGKTTGKTLFDMTNDILNKLGFDDSITVTTRGSNSVMIIRDTKNHALYISECGKTFKEV